MTENHQITTPKTISALINYIDLLRELKSANAHPGCVQCGYCCSQGACDYGEWIPELDRCLYLANNGKCNLYEDIVEREKDTEYPMMGCGCSSPLFNDLRAIKLTQLEQRNDKCARTKIKNNN